MSLIETGERELAFVLLDQALERLQRDHLTKRDMDGFRARLYSEKSLSLVGQTHIQPEGCQSHRHVAFLRSLVYT
jgi:hypothetical protein